MVIMHRLLRSQLFLYEEEHFHVQIEKALNTMFIEKMKITHTFWIKKAYLWHCIPLNSLHALPWLVRWWKKELS